VTAVAVGGLRVRCVHGLALIRFGVCLEFSEALGFCWSSCCMLGELLPGVTAD
jgi:hypothetical protein